jgi:hypothetical protein
MGDWYIWVMLALLVVTPIDPARLNGSGDRDKAARSAATVRADPQVAV